MHPINESAIRGSFVNASQRERREALLPADFDATDWESLDFLGWRDRKMPAVGYVVAEIDGEPVGIIVRQSEGLLRSRPQCSWCEDVQLPNEVVFFNAKRAGKAGKNGNTISTLVCSRFECSTNVRRRPPMAYIGFDVDAERLRRIDVLRGHVRNFILEVVAE